MRKEGYTASQVAYGIDLEKAHEAASKDIKVHGEGWIRIFPKDDGYMTAERVNPRNIVIVGEEE